MTFDEAKTRCPEGIVVACNNSENAQTISGPVDLVTKFVEQLETEEIFAKEIESSGVAFHSPHMEIVAPAFKSDLQKVNNEIQDYNNKYILNRMVFEITFWLDIEWSFFVK